MSLSLLITINALADFALLAGLAYVMSRATRLKPHVASPHATQSARAHAPAQRHQARTARSGRPQVAHSRASIANHAGTPAAAARES